MTPRLLQLLEVALADGWWVPLETYLKKHPADSRDAVYSRCSRGEWVDGEHTRIPQGGRMWVNLIAAAKWRACDRGGRTTLYRHFAADGRLLYVGIAVHEPTRRAAHRREAVWFPLVVRTDSVDYETRGAALDAERLAIRDERPAFNIVGLPD